VCLLGASLTTEYLMVLSTGFVALLVGGEAREGEAARGEFFLGEGWFGGDRDAGRDAGRDGGRCVGGSGGGVEGGSGRVSRAKSVRLPAEPPLMEEAAGACILPCSWPRSVLLSELGSPSPVCWCCCSPSARSPACSADCSGDSAGPSVGGRVVAIPVPGLRIGNSSSVAIDALADPGFRIGNSSSSGVLGIGIGAEMVPRMDLFRGLARPAVEPDFPKMLGMAAGARCRSVVEERRGYGETGWGRG
jgi:hypothetical protein